MTVETEDDLDNLKRIGKVVAQILRTMMEKCEPGMTSMELDTIGTDLFEQHGVRSAPQLSYNFPGCTCISINEEAAHGIPGDRIINPGDVVNIDVSAESNGYFADTGGSFVVPPSNALKNRLCYATKLALHNAINKAKAGEALNKIGKSIQSTARQKGFKVIRNLCSHGVGRGLHEDPKQIPSYFNPNDKRVLGNGMVITIEPFLSTKNQLVKEAKDGWTLIGDKGNLSAQYEHTMVITKGKPILITVC